MVPLPPNLKVAPRFLKLLKKSYLICFVFVHNIYTIVNACACAYTWSLIFLSTSLADIVGLILSREKRLTGEYTAERTGVSGGD